MVVCGLAACGGSDDSLTEPDSPVDKAAGFASLAVSLVGDSLDSDESAQAKMSGLALKKSGMYKAETTESCDGGGTVTYDEDADRAEYSDCVSIYTSGGYTLTTVMNGEAGVEGALNQARGYIEALGVSCDAVVTDGIRYRVYDGARDFEPLAYANLARLKRPAAELFRRLRRP